MAMGIAFVFVRRRLPGMKCLAGWESSGLIRVRRSLILPAFGCGLSGLGHDDTEEAFSPGVHTGITDGSACCISDHLSKQLPNRIVQTVLVFHAVMHARLRQPGNHNGSIRTRRG